ncbi:MAG TPA: 1-deoxy-D-xylulose-5-phosphate reductoisomerase [Termitinemataceae bacterium]|uniref:1-deoxy-D-xylulose-5-phosphate reductoisomerase n=1 Tax=Treponema sp. J25 TaxID=2094121 RepID=UPI0010533135|nr:1-deoxy-D-xylulose-5-phosphate reductoisomerase [Treponema sp. J25]TCW60781.1 1-deoxy-D-xylulose-5-phosphate reductoisomerase [Treponema sp. J25]HOJ98157.1 1-deoxy-D-xylulose-5-phosphate reductoisomerase [Termitinemataceae bacterium]HOM22433.1 1-deoxy-D-xylulose-5-phosphate reductoisomerase [Termitinemataceae bacterium]HPP99567.1 1-deoxy-D-xylulose-5-phosphate reductoisomerase [Termitinemataceae bacterium]
MKKRVAILGATGSIGKNALDVIRAHPDFFSVVLLSSHRDEEGLLRIGKDFPDALLALSGSSPSNSKRAAIQFFGQEGLLSAINESHPDIVVNGIAGAAGLLPSLKAIEAGATLALANKETLVMAGPLVFDQARRQGVAILPVDSEHSALFHLVNAHGKERVEELILTASGGPFRSYAKEELAKITAQEALNHPTWKMGGKITIDSASLANKGLEVIEAVRLFAMPPEKIKVVVHPQSIVHSLIRLSDGALYAQLSQPDMRLPIHNALFWPSHEQNPFGRLEIPFETLTFEAPDIHKFPMLSLAYEAIRKGGVYPAVYNAANEVAVELFVKGALRFIDIPALTEEILQRDWIGCDTNLDDILDADQKARDLAFTFSQKISEK